jgi:hypothetical protein
MTDTLFGLRGRLYTGMSTEIKTLNASQLSAMAKLFSSRVLLEMATKGRSPLFSRLAEESDLLRLMVATAPVRELFELAFQLLKKKLYRHEYAYKAAITQKLLLGVHSLRTASLLTEFRVGSCKADVAILNGTSSVYEIKSERDRLGRLPAQIAAYREVFAKVNIVAAEEHLSEILNIVPADVGLFVLTERFRISTVRESQSDPDQLRSETIFESVTRGEAVRILESLKIDVPVVPNTRLHAELRVLFKALPAKDVHEKMVAVLRESRSSSRLSELIDILPDSLRTVALTTRLHPKDHQKLIKAIETPIGDALAWA